MAGPTPGQYANFWEVWGKDRVDKVFCERCGKELKVDRHKRGHRIYDTLSGEHLREFGIAVAPADKVGGKMQCNSFKCRLIDFLLFPFRVVCPPYFEYYMVDGEIYRIFSESPYST